MLHRNQIGEMMTESLIVTHPAAAKVWELIEEEGNFDLKLRVYVTGGGCSGFQYGFTFDEVINTDDTIVNKKLDDSEHSVQVLVDAMSFQYLAGSEIDYLEDLDGARFIIRNPNATTKCGCGSSFAVE
jgi:iron-sulfur cluster insertion protein